jgi:predicted AAA+ superfamily ATPase
MKRTYEYLLEKHLKEHRQMIFLSGPRQVGKTTTSLEASLISSVHHYFNWDDDKHRKLIIEGADAVALAAQLERLHSEMPILVFDEIHKYRYWKRFLKGFFDVYGKKCRVFVTGSARLDIYKRGGDSLMGRYFLYRLHPLTIREIAEPVLKEKEIQEPVESSQENYEALMTYGGFPEPYLKRSRTFFNQWKRLRLEQLFREDIRDLSHIQEISQVRLLADILQEEASHSLNHSVLASKIKVSTPTLVRWMEVLKNLYFCFTIQPWSKNLTRSLIKEPKIYLWNWAFIEDRGSKYENMIASHLYKAVQFWTDQGLGEYGLYYLRDKDKREVDFLVTKEKKPWFLVEAKASGFQGISKWLYYYQEKLKVPHAFQIGFDLPFVNQDCFAIKEPVIVPAKTFLSQLV